MERVRAELEQAREAPPAAAQSALEAFTNNDAALQNTGAALVSLGLMWLSWVLAVAMVALTLHRHAGHAAPRRGVTIAGLLATPLPWFGLATARMMMS